MFGIYLIGFLFTLGFVTGLDKSQKWNGLVCAIAWPIALLIFAGIAVGNWYGMCVE